MIDHAVLLDARADTFPSGLVGTPFEAVYLALRMVAADVWDVDPRAYRAAIAWGWYLTHRPADLAGFRDLLCNALVSEAAPLVKPTQTVEELIGYLGAWREYKPTYGQLEALYGYFAASADIQPVEGERFFYICISGIDWSRPLTYDEAFAIAQRATPLGAFFNIYFRYEDELSIPVRCADYIGFTYRIGDDYELSRPVAPAPSYEEIKLYGNVSSTIFCQNNITSGFTENVNTANVLQLYTDNTYTTPWKGYDYSNDYEMGFYSSGVWYSRGGTISDLPSTTANPESGETVSCLFILLDTGCLWFVCNNSNNNNGYTNQHARFYGTITLRIYPKDQQYYAGYFKYNNLYTNYSLAASRPLYPWPYGTSANYKAWFSSYPTASFVKFLGSATNELSNVGNVSLSRDSSNALTVTRTGYSGSINVRCVIYTLNTPTFYAWVQRDKSETPLFNNADYTLYDSSGAPIPYDSFVSYKAIGIFIASGANCATERNVIAGSAITNVNGNLAFRKVSGVGITASKIWYIKTQIV